MERLGGFPVPQCMCCSMGAPGQAMNPFYQSPFTCNQPHPADQPYRKCIKEVNYEQFFHTYDVPLIRKKRHFDTIEALSASRFNNTSAFEQTHWLFEKCSELNKYG